MKKTNKRKLIELMIEMELKDDICDEDVKACDELRETLTYNQMKYVYEEIGARSPMSLYNDDYNEFIMQEE